MRKAAVMMVTMMLAVLVGCGASVAEEKAAIAAALQAKYGGNNTVVIETIVLRQKFAVADWVMGDIGGRSILHEDGKWQVVLTTGQDARDPAFLQKAGMPADVAKALATMLVTNERNIPEEKLAKLDRFAAAP